MFVLNMLFIPFLTLPFNLNHKNRGTLSFRLWHDESPYAKQEKPTILA